MDNTPELFVCYYIGEDGEDGQTMVGVSVDDPSQGHAQAKYVRQDIHQKAVNAAYDVTEKLGRAKLELASAKRRETQMLEAIAILAGAGNVSPTELAQLGVGRVVQNPHWKPGDDPRNRYAFMAMDLNDLADMNERAMREQATVAKFRQLKQHFTTHQRAVSYLLDQVDNMATKNSLTGKDLDKLRTLRGDLADLIGRKL